MIARYSRSEAAEIWSDRSKYQAWLDVEFAVCEELAQEGLIPKSEFKKLSQRVKALEKKGGLDPERVDFHEKKVRHDVIAFTTALAEKIGPPSRYIHFGLTSSDVVDTAFALLLKKSGILLLADIEKLLATLKRLALKYKNLPAMGRSHGISAEPVAFGLRFLSWYTEWKRNHERLTSALEDVSYGKLSGAVGVCAHWNPGFETRVLKRLGLYAEPMSSQVVPRDRVAHFMSTLALCGSSMERIAVELRHLQRSEVGEVMEGFKPGQKGSSAMPHKRNPISSENLTGCARMLRAYATPSLESVALWHERDISHSSVERLAIPDGVVLLDYALNRLERVLSELVVNEDRVRENLQSVGQTVFSGHYLLALVKKGVTREQAYAWVQECALKSLSGGGSLIELLLLHPKISKILSEQEIRNLGSLDYQLRNVDAIYRRALR